MSHVQFITLIRLPFIRGQFEDPPQAQWDAEKDRQLWKVISKSSKTSDLNWVELADKFQVPPTFLLQQAAWLYERHLDHVRNQMKRVSGSNVPTSITGASTLTPTGGIAMLRTGSGGSGAHRTSSALSGRQWETSATHGTETSVTSPPLSRTPSTNTITQSRATTQQIPFQQQSTRIAQRPEERRIPASTALTSPFRETIASPDIPGSSSSSSSSSSDADHPAHRSQLFKRPPRFKQQRSRDLSSLEENVRRQGVDGSGSHSPPGLPFVSSAQHMVSPKFLYSIGPRASKKPQEARKKPQEVARSTRSLHLPQRVVSSTETSQSTATDHGADKIINDQLNLRKRNNSANLRNIDRKIPTLEPDC